MTRYQERDVLSLGPVPCHERCPATQHPVSCDPTPRRSTTVVSPVEVGELLCDTLEEAEDAAFLSFLLLENESIVAEKSSYIVTSGGAFTDGIGRKVRPTAADYSGELNARKVLVALIVDVCVHTEFIHEPRSHGQCSRSSLKLTRDPIIQCIVMVSATR